MIYNQEQKEPVRRRRREEEKRTGDRERIDKRTKRGKGKNPNRKKRKREREHKRKEEEEPKRMRKNKRSEGRNEREGKEMLECSLECLKRDGNKGERRKENIPFSSISPPHFASFPCSLSSLPIFP